MTLGIILLVYRNIYSETRIKKIWPKEKHPECPMYQGGFWGGGLYHPVLE